MRTPYDHQEAVQAPLPARWKATARCPWCPFVAEAFDDDEEAVHWSARDRLRRHLGRGHGRIS